MLRIVRKKDRRVSLLTPDCIRGLHDKDGEMRQERRTRGDPSVEGGDTGPPTRTRMNIDNGFSVTRVELTKKEGCNLGLVVTGGIDKDLKPRVSYLKPGGIAHRSDVLQEGDFIISVNGIRTALLKHDEIVSLLRNAGENVILELEYELPDPPQETFSVLCKRIEVSLDRDGDSFGFTLRGGRHSDPMKCRPLTITQIRPGGSADREGTLKVGDRILGISGVNVANFTLTEALTLLHKSHDAARLQIEYDVSVMDAVEHAVGPLLVEIDKAAGSPLGLSVTSCNYRGRSVITIHEIQAASIADRCGALHIGDHILAIDDTSFEHVSVAEATQILKCTTGGHVKLEIVPIRHIKAQSQGSLEEHGKYYKDTRQINGSNPSSRQTSSEPSPVELRKKTSNYIGSSELRGSTSSKGSSIAEHSAPLSNHVTDSDNSNHGSDNRRSTNTVVNGNKKYSDVGPSDGIRSDRHHSSNTSLQSLAYKQFTNIERTYTSMTTQMGSAANSPTGTLQRHPPTRHSGRPHRYNTGLLTPHNSISFSNVMLPGHQVCHTEVTEVILVSDLRGFGITLGGSGLSEDTLNEPPFISFIEPRSVAERCGVLQEGDRILTINGTMLEKKNVTECMNILTNSGIRVSLLVEFDVAESIIPSSGIFNVKVAKKGSGLGITIAAPKNRRSCDPLIISDVKRGSVAHRTGTIQPGDKLLAIDNFRLEGCSIEDAAHILQDTDDIVRLRLQKQEQTQEEPVNMVTYTVELQRCGGPLGVTISGTEEPLDPIFISGLTEGGLAERTGALHIGDRILAINSRSLRGNTLTDAIKLLQTAGDTVTLKITRPLRTANPMLHSKQTTKPHDVRRSHDSVDSALESWDSSGLDSNGRGKHSIELCREGSGSSTSTSQDGTNTSAYHSLGRQSGPSYSRPQSATSYNDLSRELKYIGDKTGALKVGPSAELISRLSDLGKGDVGRSPVGSIVSSGEQDEWSQQVDALDKLGPLTQHSQADTFSGFKNTSNNNKNTLNDTDFNDLSDTLDFSSDLQQGAQLQIKEVESELEAILTPTPMELHKVVLNKLGDMDYGFSLSDGVYEKGVYISALRPNGPAHLAGVRPYDKLLQINSIKVKDMSCHEVVPLISLAGHLMELVISRNPLAGEQCPLEDEDDTMWESASMILDSKMV